MPERRSKPGAIVQPDLPVKLERKVFKRIQDNQFKYSLILFFVLIIGPAGLTGIPGLPGRNGVDGLPGVAGTPGINYKLGIT